ncbi:MAG TPA: transposase, partial [Myxococcales bacterium]
MRLRHDAGYLRSYQRAKIIEDALRAARERVGVRVIHYSIQGNHLHLIVEAESPEALSRAMQGLATRLARRLNQLSG